MSENPFVCIVSLSAKKYEQTIHFYNTMLWMYIGASGILRQQAVMFSQACVCVTLFARLFTTTDEKPTWNSAQVWHSSLIWSILNVSMATRKGTDDQPWPTLTHVGPHLRCYGDVKQLICRLAPWDIWIRNVRECMLNETMVRWAGTW